VSNTILKYTGAKPEVTVEVRVTEIGILKIITNLSFQFNHGAEKLVLAKGHKK
jgi:hypothetical protein